MIGVKTDAESRYAVSTQVTVFWSVLSSVSISDSTGIVSDCMSVYDETATARTANVSQ